MKSFFSKRGLSKIKETEEAGGGGAALTNWTPTVTPGINLVFTRYIGGVGEITNHGHTFMVSDIYNGGGGGVGGGYVTQPVYDSPNTNGYHYPFHFQLPDPTGVTGACYAGMADSVEENPPSVFLACVLNPSGVGTNIDVLAVGNMQTSDFTTGALGALATITWQPNSQFIISYDPNGGTYGTVHLFYSGSGTPNTPVVSHVLTEAIAATPNAPGGQVSVSDGSTWGFTIINEPLFTVTPTLPIEPFTIVSGGQFDPASIPADAAGKTVNIDALVTPIVIPGHGVVTNGDVLSFNLDGTIEGRVWTPDEIVEMIPVVKNGQFGLLPFQPTPQPNPNETKLDAGFLPNERGNKTYQVVGLVFPLIWENPSPSVASITIYNGDILGFNSDFDLVMHLSRSNLT